MWNLETGEQRYPIEKGASRAVLALASDIIAIASYQNIALHRADSGQQRGNNLTGQYDGYPASLAFSPDGTLLASSGDDGAIKLWNPRNEAYLDSFVAGTQKVWALAFSPDGATLASLGDDETLRLWDVATRKEIWQDNQFLPSMPSAVFTPDSQSLVVAADKVSLQVRRVRDGTVVRYVGDGEQTGRNWIYNLALSRDGRLAAAAVSGADQVLVYTLADGMLLQQLPGIKSPRSIDFSPDATLLAAASELSNTVTLWSPESGALLQTLDHAAGVWRVRFSPDGALLVAGTLDGGISLWQRDGEQFVLRQEVKEHTGAVRDLVFTPDGAALVSVSLDGGVKLLNTTDGSVIRVFAEGDSINWTSAVVSSDGKLLVVAENDGEHRLRFHEVASGRQLGELKTAQTGYIDNIAFSPDNRLVAVPSWDGTLRLYGVP